MKQVQLTWRAAIRKRAGEIPRRRQHHLIRRCCVFDRRGRWRRRHAKRRCLRFNRNWVFSIAPDRRRVRERKNASPRPKHFKIFHAWKTPKISRRTAWCYAWGKL